MRKYLVILLVLLLTLNLFSARTPKDTLVIAVNTDNVVTLDPGAVYEVLGSRIVDACYEKLVGLDYVNGQLIVVPEVAESWEISEDGRTYTFHIRRGIKFSTGRELTAEDVVFSLKRHLLMQKPSSWILPSMGVTKDNMDETIKKIDDYTVQITVDKPYAPTLVLSKLTFSFSGIVDKKEVLKHEQNGDLGHGWLSYHSAGAGAYYVKSWEKNAYIILEANKYYWRGQPRIKRIVFKDVPEPTNQRLLLERGDVDIAWDLLPENIEELKGNPDIKIITGPGHEFRYLAMNTGWGPLKDPKVRLAIKYAIAYDEFVEEVKRGYAMKVQGFIMKGYTCFVSKTPFHKDVEKAKKLLAEAGYPNGFEVELMTAPIWKDDAVKVQADLAEIGIKAKLVIMQRSQMYAKYRKQGHQMVVARWGSDYPDPDALAQPFANYEMKSLAWRNMWKDDYAIMLTNRAAYERNLKKRCQMYEDLTDYWFLNGPFAILYQVKNAWAVRKEVKGFEEASQGYSMRLEFSHIYKE